jgi:DNA-binding IclR family transcriptional regulator
MNVISMLSQPGTSLSLTEVSQCLQVNKSTCYSMLTALTRAGWVTRDPMKKSYVIGPAMIEIGRNAANAFPTMRIAHPAMTQLAFGLGINCSAVRAADGQIIMIDQVKDLRASRDPYIPGINFPMRAPFGAYFIRDSSSAAFEEWISGASIEARLYLKGVLDRYRSDGFLVERRLTHEQRIEASRRSSGSIEETLASLPDIALSADEGFYIMDWNPKDLYAIDVIGSPVFGRTGEVDLVITLSGFEERVSGAEIDRMSNALCATTTSLTSALSEGKA